MADSHTVIKRYADVVKICRNYSYILVMVIMSLQRELKARSVVLSPIAIIILLRGL